MYIGWTTKILSTLIAVKRHVLYVHYY